MNLEFYKMEGCGNTLLVLQAPPKITISWQETSRALLNPNYGVGADSLMLLKGGDAANGFNIEIYNRDGSSAESCGNGIRCVVRYLVLKNILKNNIGEVKFLVWGRPTDCSYTDGGRSVTVNMGEPSFEPKDVPVLSDGEVVNAPLEVLRESFHITAVAMPNPHCVVFVPALDNLKFEEAGPALCNHKIFPDRANVEFVERIRDDFLKVKVWERGVGPTLACGTGACAVVVAGVKTGLCFRKTEVELPGGILGINWDEPSNQVFMTGPAREIFVGNIDLSKMLPQLG